MSHCSKHGNMISDREERDLRFAIFLDVDGVLNMRTMCERSPEGYKGIDDAKVDIDCF